MTSTKIPLELRKLIDSEDTDFIVKSKRNAPKKQAYGMLFFSLFWNAFISIFVFAFITPVLMGEEVHFTANDIPTSASLENWEPIIVPSIIIGVFVIIGIGLFIYALRLFFQEGGYFVGTETRFIQFRNDTFTIKDWEQFSGNMNITSKRALGDLELELRTGKMQKRNKQASRYVPDIIYMSGIPNVFDIEKKCRLRIKENDPTPTLTQT